jgi:adenylyltransferase/sulfurtransferase
MPEQPIEENNCETAGIFSPVAGILGSLQANEVIKTILGLKDDLNNNVLIFNSLNMTLRKVKISKNPKCINKCKY